MAYPTMNGGALRSGDFRPTRLFKKAKEHLQHTATFENSVDETNLVQIDHTANPWWRSHILCWEVKGRIADEYNCLGPKILRELQQSCKESSQEIFVEPYMVGKSPQKARPVIVIASEDKTTREDAKRVIEDSDIIQEYPHFKLWPLRYLPTGPVNPVAAQHSVQIELSPSEGPTAGIDTAMRYVDLSSITNSALPLGRRPGDTSGPTTTRPPVDVYYDPSQPVRPIGLTIYIEQTEDTLRRATANAVFQGTEYGYLTAAHVLLQSGSGIRSSDPPGDHFDFPFDVDSESETEDGIRTSSLSFQSEHLEFKHQDKLSDRGVSLSMLATAKGLLNANLRKLGTISLEETSTDYTVIQVTDEPVLEFLASIPKSTRNISKPCRSTVTAWTSRGAVHGHLLGIPLYMRMPNSKSLDEVYKFAYESAIMYGDSGSLVTNSETRIVYGFLVADTQRQRVAFMISLEKVLGIRRQEVTWNLVTLDTQVQMTVPREEARRTSILQFWYDRRNKVQWYTFWIAVLILCLTVFFGLVQSIEGALQVYKAYHPTT
jgi:hypothetical protein